jgi:hypothetical protein
MEEIVSSLPVYNVLTNLIPGTVLATLLKLYVKGCDIFSFSDNVLILVVIFYFLGVVSARISSLLVEPLLMKLKIVKYESHKDYTNAELREQTEKLTQLSRMSIEYRNYLSVFIIVLVLKLSFLSSHVEEFVANNSGWPILCLGGLLFLFSYRKQTRYVSSRITQLNKNN